MKARTQHIGIVGAGLAGLTAGLDLARAGYRVTVAEAEALLPQLRHKASVNQV